MAKIYHAHLYGLREDKYQILKENTVNSTDFHEVNPQSPFYLLIPQNTDLFGEYEQYFKITDIMPINSVGIVTARDKLTIQDTSEDIWNIVNDFASLDIEEARDKYKLGEDSRDWKVDFAQDDLKNSGISKNKIEPILYRPFDIKFTYYTGKSRGFICMPRPEVTNQILNKINLILLVKRQGKRDPYSYFYISNRICESCIFESAYANNSILPLYIYPDSDKAQELQQEKRPNFSPDFLKTLETKLGYLPTPETIFYYIYAVFHSPTYRSRYAEFLKIDFPRVPLTSNDNLFRQLAEYGEQLVQLHLMTSPKLDPPLAPSSKRGGVEAPLIKGGWGALSFVSKSDRIVAAGHPKYSKGEVHINKQGDCFRGVPEAVWNFYIGGYQVCQKWLKDRKGRTLSDEDILHYHKIVVALAETIKLMQLIDAAIPSFPIK
ncbi:helicase [Microcystis aeruginosa CS-1036]|uniref:type ISP restriction/modification enzyme n=1 Tax=Microcystis aeruginosa TaxID=1126 RepID=UPI00232F1890|nr:type ISP restriction/modification enzyme [Microcystis aeruginosa]MDB9541803.1 helicase [Microcystis aeruginosa CS-1036]